MNLWITMILAGLATYLIRLSFIALMNQSSMPNLIIRSLLFIPPAVLTAIIFPEMFLRDGVLDFSFGNTRLIAGLIAGLVAWRTRNAVITIVVGMIVLWGLGWLGASL